MKAALPILLSASLVAHSALAGAPADPVIEPPVIVEEAQSSSGGVILPLLLLVLVAAAVADSSGGGGVVGTSDERIKTDIVRVGTGAYDLPIYQFRYAGLPGVYEGVMAQDVAKVMPSAVVEIQPGLLGVDYGALGMEMRWVH
ncbi:MAG: tail fiber domain-containing protein [Pseudomonadota bacterium]